MQTNKYLKHLKDYKHLQKIKAMYCEAIINNQDNLQDYITLVDNLEQNLYSKYYKNQYMNFIGRY